MTRMIGKYLLVALVLQVLLKRYIPTEWVEGILGSSQTWSVVLSSIIGVPLYVNGISAVPVLQGLLRMGMDPGAVLAFLVAGPVMTVPSVVAVMSELCKAFEDESFECVAHLEQQYKLESDQTVDLLIYRRDQGTAPGRTDP